MSFEGGLKKGGGLKDLTKKGKYQESLFHPLSCICVLPCHAALKSQPKQKKKGGLTSTSFPGPFPWLDRQEIRWTLKLAEICQASR